MATRRNYAYGVMVQGKKRFGGTISADTMEDAVAAIAKRTNLTIATTPIWCLPDAVDWILEGKRASIYIWAPPEYFQEDISK